MIKEVEVSESVACLCVGIIIEKMEPLINRMRMNFVSTIFQLHPAVKQKCNQTQKK
jgi:hypothetical protein